MTDEELITAIRAENARLRLANLRLTLGLLVVSTALLVQSIHYLFWGTS